MSVSAGLAAHDREQYLRPNASVVVILSDLQFQVVGWGGSINLPITSFGGGYLNSMYPSTTRYINLLSHSYFLALVFFFFFF